MPILKPLSSETSMLSVLCSAGIACLAVGSYIQGEDDVTAGTMVACAGVLFMGGRKCRREPNYSPFALKTNLLASAYLAQQFIETRDAKLLGATALSVVSFVDPVKMFNRYRGGLRREAWREEVACELMEKCCLSGEEGGADFECLCDEVTLEEVNEGGGGGGGEVVVQCDVSLCKSIDSDCQETETGETC